MNGTHPKRIVIQERRAQALELRRAGASLRKIGGLLGVSAKQIQRDLQATLEGMNEENSQTAAFNRALELERLDAMLLSLKPLLEPGEDKHPHMHAIDRALKISEQRSKLLGLYMPIKQDVNLFGHVKAYKGFSPDDWDDAAYDAHMQMGATSLSPNAQDEGIE